MSRFRSALWRHCRRLPILSAVLCGSAPAFCALPPIEDHYFGATLFVARTAQTVTPPMAVGSLAAYQSVYGRLADAGADHGYQAARLFFANGGRVLYVVDPRGSTLQQYRDALAATASLPVDLVALPGLAESGLAPDLHRAIGVALSEQVSASDNRFGLIDAPRDSDMGTLLAFVAAFSSAHAALYAPWLDVADGSASIAMPPSAAVAGVISRVDRDQGIFKAPAGTGSALSASVGTSLRQLFDNTELDLLAQEKVNPLRRIAGSGEILIWGSRTTSADPEWRYVSVSRLLRLLGFSMRRSLSWVPVSATPPTAAEVTALIQDYLDAYRQRGAFASSTPSQAYFVHCGDVDNRLDCVVGVAPLRPAEFILLRLSLPYHDRLFANGFEVQ